MPLIFLSRESEFEIISQVANQNNETTQDGIDQVPPPTAIGVPASFSVNNPSTTASGSHGVLLQGDHVAESQPTTSGDIDTLAAGNFDFQHDSCRVEVKTKNTKVGENEEVRVYIIDGLGNRYSPKCNGSLSFQCTSNTPSSTSTHGKKKCRCCLDIIYTPQGYTCSQRHQHEIHCEVRYRKGPSKNCKVKYYSLSDYLLSFSQMPSDNVP